MWSYLGMRPIRRVQSAERDPCSLAGLPEGQCRDSYNSLEATKLWTRVTDFHLQTTLPSSLVTYPHLFSPQNKSFIPELNAVWALLKGSCCDEPFING